MVPKFTKKVFVEWINPDRVKTLGVKKVNNAQHRRPAVDDGDPIWQPKTLKRDLNEKGVKVASKITTKDDLGTKKPSELARIAIRQANINKEVSSNTTQIATENQR